MAVWVRHARFHNKSLVIISVHCCMRHAKCRPNEFHCPFLKWHIASWFHFIVSHFNLLFSELVRGMQRTWTKIETPGSLVLRRYMYKLVAGKVLPPPITLPSASCTLSARDTSNYPPWDCIHRAHSLSLAEYSVVPVRWLGTRLTKWPFGHPSSELIWNPNSIGIKWARG